VWAAVAMQALGLQTLELQAFVWMARLLPVATGVAFPAQAESKKIINKLE